MKLSCRLFLAMVLIGIAPCSGAHSDESQCLREEVEAHVREQFTIYGPRSAEREYFGFVYVHDGVIGSAVTRSGPCYGAKCMVDSAEALRSMPPSAKVLGEWHTHPHRGSPGLSKEDVRGAYNNRHISCYRAFYSTPGGEIYAWSPSQLSVPVAMATRALVGSYKGMPARGLTP
jgi:proteasome lid subunit RPN8/RPN11